jgi:TonB family protein
MDADRAMTRSVAPVSRCWVACCLLAGCLAASVSAARADPPDQDPWQRPGYGIVGRAAVAAYPPAALRARTPGQAIVTCERDAVGKPHDCRIASEAPAGQGFGAAALNLMNEAPAEGAMEPSQRQRLPFRFVFGPKPPTITPDVFHPAEMSPEVSEFPTTADSYRIGKEMGLSDPYAITGAGKIECSIGGDGFLTDCKLLSETPPGTGLGALQLKLAPLNRFYRFTDEGFPATGIRNITEYSQAPAGAR